MMQQVHTGNGRRALDHGRPIGELFGDLADQARTLVQQEVQLASAEMSEKAARVGRNSAKIAAGGLVLYAGLLAVIAGIAIGLAELLSPDPLPWEVAIWVSPLVVGLVVGFIGYALLQHGISTIRDTDLRPRKTTQSLRETKRWMQEKMT